MQPHLITAMGSPPPLVRLRIAYRCLVMSWHESESLPVFVLFGAIVILLGVPLVVLAWKAGQ